MAEYDIGTETGLNNDQIAKSIFNERIDYLLQSKYKDSESIPDADDSICTLSLGATSDSVDTVDIIDSTVGEIIETLTNQIDYVSNTEKFFHSLAMEVFEYGNYYARLATVSTLQTGNVDDNYSQVLPKWEFYTDAQSIAINLMRSSQFTLQVDGVYHSKSTLTAPDPGDNFSQQLLSFDGKKTRKITINFSSGASGFRGVSVLPTDSVWAMQSPLKVVLDGDSFSTGTNPNIGGLSYVPILFSRLNINNYMVSGEGGTGFVNNQDDTKYNYVDRVSDVTSVNPDIVFVSLTVNDNGYESDLPTAIDNWYTTVRTALPNAMIIVLGAQGRTDTSTQTMEQAAITQFESYDDTNLIIVPIVTADDPIISGTGNDGSLADDGNADIYIYSDGTHYNEDGHIFAGNQTYQRVIDALESARR